MSKHPDPWDAAHNVHERANLLFELLLRLTQYGSTVSMGYLNEGDSPDFHMSLTDAGRSVLTLATEIAEDSAEYLYDLTSRMVERNPVALKVDAFFRSAAPALRDIESRLANATDEERDAERDKRDVLALCALQELLGHLVHEAERAADTSRPRCLDEEEDDEEAPEATAEIPQLEAPEDGAEIPHLHGTVRFHLKTKMDVPDKDALYVVAEVLRPLALLLQIADERDSQPGVEREQDRLRDEAFGAVEDAIPLARRAVENLKALFKVDFESDEVEAFTLEVQNVATAAYWALVGIMDDSDRGAREAGGPLSERSTFLAVTRLVWDYYDRALAMRKARATA